MELFLQNKKAISKNEILSIVWNYSKDADTHTVETHISTGLEGRLMINFQMKTSLLIVRRVIVFEKKK